MTMTRALTVAAVGFLLLFAASASADIITLWNQDFSTDTAGWFGGITQNPGTQTATVARDGGAYTRFGGYNYGAGGGVPTTFEEYWTSIDIYLDVAGGWANDTRFDWSSAINGSDGNHRRDFIFNAGFYNDSDGSPGSGTSRFVISASNNSQPGNAYAKNPGRGPIAISTSGWYTFEHHFYDNGGVLAVDMSIFDSSDSLVNRWTLSNPLDLISGIGGNRYGWFDYNQFSSGLTIDNSSLSVIATPVPEPASVGLLGMGLVGLVATRIRKRLSA